MKKRMIWIICSIVVILAIVAMLLFIVKGKKADVESDSMLGTWLILAEKENGVVNVPEENQFLVFDEEYVNKFIDNGSEAVFTDEYEYKGSNLLTLKKSGLSYHIENKGNNIYSLWQDDNNSYNIVRYPDASRNKVIVDKKILINQWIVYRNGQDSNEEIVFSDNDMKDYRDDKEKPFITSNYEWRDDKTLVIEAIDLCVRYMPLSDKEINFVDESTGEVMNLQLKK